MKLSDTDIERIAEAVCRKLDHRETVREDARYLAGMDTDDLIEHQRNLSRLARRGRRNESEVAAQAEAMGR